MKSVAPHTSLRICFSNALLISPPQREVPVGSSTYRIVYPYHLSIIDPGIREGSVGGEEEMRFTLAAGLLLSSRLRKKNSIYYHMALMAQSLLSSLLSFPGAPRIPCPSWLPPAARRVVRGRLSLARWIISSSIAPLLVPRFYRKRVKKKALSRKLLFFFCFYFYFYFI